MKKVLLAAFGLIAILTLAACGPKNNDSKVIVTYMVDETVYKTDEIDYRAYITLPSEPTKEGYKFEYWMLNDARYDISTSIKENITLKAFFTEGKRDYQVSFYDGNTVIKTQSVDQNSFVSTYAPTKEGYAFANWYTDTALTKIFDFSTKVTSNLSLYAKWNKNDNGNTDPVGPNDPKDYSGYYASLSGLSGAQFNNELQRIIKTTGSATGSTSQVKKVDNVGGKYYLIYTGNGSYGNREHVFPAKWFRSYNVGTEDDLHNLRAANVSVNSTRSSFPFGPGTGKNWKLENGKFYPGSDHIGDVARIVLFIATRWGFKVTDVGTLDLFLQWHEQDPVDDFEIARNNNIFEIQKNRNPFIDHPEYVSYFFGESSKKSKNSFGIRTQQSIFTIKSTLKLMNETIKHVDLKEVKGIQALQ